MNAPIVIPELRTDIERADEGTSWQEYIAEHRDATFFHDWRWRGAIERTFGYEPIYLTAKRGAVIVGVLPLIDVTRPLFGRALMSTAFTIGGGVLANDAGAANALGAAALDLAAERQIKFVELRGGAALEGFKTKAGAHEGWSRALAETDEAELKAIPRKRRAEIRKGLAWAEEGRMTIRHDATADEFYDLYAISLRNLGTPAFSRRFPRAIAEAFGDDVFFSLVEADGEPLFSLCTFQFRDCLMPYYAGVTPAARATKAADYAYFALMGEARRRGLKTFDFGRSKVGSSHAAYKKSWGFGPTPIEYQIATPGAEAAPDISPNNPKFALMTATWRRLPMPIANTLGPIVARNLA